MLYFTRRGGNCWHACCYIQITFFLLQQISGNGSGWLLSRFRVCRAGPPPLLLLPHNYCRRFSLSRSRHLVVPPSRSIFHGVQGGVARRGRHCRLACRPSPVLETAVRLMCCLLPFTVCRTAASVHRKPVAGGAGACIVTNAMLFCGAGRQWLRAARPWCRRAADGLPSGPYVRRRGERARPAIFLMPGSFLSGA